MTESEHGDKGSWWTTLPGVLTGLAGLLTAVGGLVAALNEAGLLKPSPSPPAVALQDASRGLDPTARPPPPAPVPVSPAVLGALPQVEGVGVKIVAVRRIRDKGGMFIDLDYRVTTGSDFSRHDPTHFVQLVSGSVALAPVWSSVSARELPPNSRQDILVRFPLPTGEASSVVFRFGEEHRLDLPAQVEN